MQKKHLIFFFGFITMLTILCGFSLFRTFVAGTYQCLPISYPEGEFLNLQSHETQFIKTSASIRQIKEFYDAKLNPKSIHAAEPYLQGSWRIQKLNDEIPLFDCYNGVNTYIGESGCIFLHEKEDGTVIEFTWALGESAPSCQSTYSSVNGVEYSVK